MTPRASPQAAVSSDLSCSFFICNCRVQDQSWSRPPMTFACIGPTIERGTGREDSAIPPRGDTAGNDMRFTGGVGLHGTRGPRRVIPSDVSIGVTSQVPSCSCCFQFTCVRGFNYFAPVYGALCVLPLVCIDPSSNCTRICNISKSFKIMYISNFVNKNPLKIPPTSFSVILHNLFYFLPPKELL